MASSDKIDGRRSADGKSLISLSRRVHAWLSPGQDWIVEIGGVEIAVRLVERRGRRARVTVEMLAEAVFSSTMDIAAQPSSIGLGEVNRR